MATLIQKERLVFSDLKKNSYKYWDGELYDDGKVISRFGVVGAKNPQECDYGHVGKAFLEKKIKEKIKKGYEHAKIIETTGKVGSEVVDKGSLADIAVSQIKFQNSVIKALIRRLADANVHKITNSTSITYNSSSGLMQTPLGILTQSAIDEARNILPFFLDKRTLNMEYEKKIDSYLKLVPRNKGHKLSYKDVFPSKESVEKELDLLDALENSLQIVTTPQTQNNVKNPVENVFNLKLDILQDENERDRISKWFYKSNHSTHGYSNVRIQEIYQIEQPDVEKRFNVKLGNINEFFHGSGTSNILSLLKSGLKTSPPSAAAIAGKLYGNGSYMAVDSSKSLQYTYGRFTGGGNSKSGWLFVLDAALGRIDYTKKYGCQPDLKCYDSIWAKKENTGLRFDEIITYKDEQVKIKYLIECK